MEHATFLQEMARLQAALSYGVSEVAMAAYWDSLSNISDERFIFACRKAAGELTKFPKPAELRELSRLYRAPESKRLTHTGDSPLPSGYAQDRMAIIMRILDGQGNKQTAQQIAALGDKYPAQAVRLAEEAESWWNQKGDWPKEVCEKAPYCHTREKCNALKAETSYARH